MPLASRLADEQSARIFAFFRRHHKTAPTAGIRSFTNAQRLTMQCALARAAISSEHARYLISGGPRSSGGKSICGMLICTLLGSIVDSPAL